MLLGSLKIEETITDQSSSISMRNKTKAEASKAALQASGRFNAPIVTSIEPAQPFYLAEEEHQEYYKKHPENFARNHARRAAFLEDHWENTHA